MQEMPAIGSRVRYREGDRECVGTVRALYPRGGATKTNRVGIEVEGKLPAWWPYPHTNRFGPDLRNLTAEA